MALLNVIYASSASAEVLIHTLDFRVQKPHHGAFLSSYRLISFFCHLIISSEALFAFFISALSAGTNSSTHVPNFKSDDSICFGLGSIDTGIVTTFIFVIVRVTGFV